MHFPKSLDALERNSDKKAVDMATLERAETFGFVVVSLLAVFSILLTIWSRTGLLHSYGKVALIVLLAAMWLTAYAGRKKHKGDHPATWAAALGYLAVMLLLK